AAEGALPRRGGAVAPGEEGEAVVEARGEVVEGHGPQACGGEFDGEGQAVERGADPGDRVGVRGGEREGGVGLAGPFGEEPDGRVRLRSGVAVFGAGERAERVDGL